MDKGLELPLNAIIVIAIAVLVLVSIFGLFGNQFFSSSGQVDVQKVFAQGCTSLRAVYGCDQTKVNDVSISGSSLGYACSQSGYRDTKQCAKACGCSVPVGETGQALQTLPGTTRTDSGEQSQQSQGQPGAGDIVFQRVETSI